MTIVCSRITPLANSCLEQRHSNLDFFKRFFCENNLTSEIIKSRENKKKIKITKMLATLAL